MTARGDIQAEWNGGPVHSFTGIRSTVIQTAESQEQSDHVQLDQSPDESDGGRGRFARSD